MNAVRQLVDVHMSESSETTNAQLTRRTRAKQEVQTKEEKVVITDILSRNESSAGSTRRPASKEEPRSRSMKCIGDGAERLTALEALAGESRAKSYESCNDRGAQLIIQYKLSNHNDKTNTRELTQHSEVS